MNRRACLPGGSPRAAALIAVLGVAGLVGCGGDDEGANEPAGAGADGRSAFYAQLDAACARTAKRFQREAKRLLAGKSGTGNEARILVKLTDGVTIPRLQDQIANLQAVEGSSEEEAAADEVSAALRREIAAIEADPEAFLGGTLDEVVETKQLARRLGLKRCGGLSLS